MSAILEPILRALIRPATSSRFRSQNSSTSVCRGDTFGVSSKADHIHVGIHAGDIVTIDATPDTHVGQLVIEQHDNTIMIGLLQREQLHEQRPGEFYVDIGDHRVHVSEDSGRMPVGKTLGVIEHHERSVA